MLFLKRIRCTERCFYCSFNNALLSEIASPPLSTVDVNIYQLGYEAAKALVDKVENAESTAKCIIIPHKLLKRQTCDHYA